MPTSLPPAALPTPSSAARSAPARSIQFFNQSPRAWRPRELLRRGGRRLPRGDGRLGRRRAADPRRLPAQLRLRGRGDPRQVADGADPRAATPAPRSAPSASCCTPARRSRTAARSTTAIERAGEVIAEALAESAEACSLHLEDTAGAGGTLGRSFEELAALIEAAGGGERLGVCLDSCHLLASGYDIRTAEGLVGRARRLRRGRRPRPARLAARQRLDDAAGLQPRPPRQPRRGRDRRRRDRRLPLRAPLRRACRSSSRAPAHAGKAVERADIENAIALRERGLKARA